MQLVWKTQAGSGPVVQLGKEGCTTFAAQYFSIKIQLAKTTREPKHEERNSLAKVTQTQSKLGSCSWRLQQKVGV